MRTERLENIERAELLLPCADLAATLDFFTGRLNFRLDSIFPAEDPAVAVVSGHGLRLRFERTKKDPPENRGIRLRLCGDFAKTDDGDEKKELTAPNGVRIQFAPARRPVSLPRLAPAFILTRVSAGGWVQGRAGMDYRDLIPDRQGGRFVASHIRVPAGGSVPDYVHYHRIRFQAIYCLRGWAELVYQDQGQPFRLRAGEMVLQPPQIRHRVLRCSEGFEAVEIASPAEHETLADHDLDLPTAGTVDPGRLYGGQRFVHFVPEGADWEEYRLAGFERRDTGIGRATGGLAGANVIRPAAESRITAGRSVEFYRHDGAEFVFFYILRGTARLGLAGSTEYLLAPDDAVVIPAETDYRLADPAADLRFLEVTLPGRFETARRPGAAGEKT